MANNKDLYGFDRNGVVKIVEGLRRVRQFVRPRQGRPKLPNTVPSRPNLQWVKVTSLTQTSGRYPGYWYTHNSSDNTMTQKDAIWIMFPNGETPILKRYYIGRQDDDVNGLACYSPIDYGALPLVVNGGADIQGGITASGLKPPSNVSGSATGGGAGTNYTYAVTGVTPDGKETDASQAVTINNNATLDGTHYNMITFTPVAGISLYNLYQLGPTPGLVTAITTTPDQTSVSTNVTSNAITPGTQPPQVNQTPLITATGIVTGGLIAKPLPTPSALTLASSTAGALSVAYQAVYQTATGGITPPSTALALTNKAQPSPGSPITLNVPIPSTMDPNLIPGTLVQIYRGTPNTTSLGNGVILVVPIPPGTLPGGSFQVTDSGQPTLTNQPTTPAASGAMNGVITASGGVAGINVVPLADPTVAPVVTPIGTTGATTYSYKFVAHDPTGTTSASPVGTTTTGNATLSGSNYNQITWLAVPGATQYDVYRTAGGATQGLIGTVQPSQSLVFLDQGATGDGSTAPAANTTGQLLQNGATVGASAQNDVWKKIVVLYTAFTGLGAVLGGAVDIGTLPAKGVVEDAYIHCDTLFAAPGLTNALAGFGYTGNDDYFIQNADVKTSTASTSFTGYGPVGTTSAAKSILIDLGSSKNLRAKITLTGANCNALTAGQFTIYYKTATLP